MLRRLGALLSASLVVIGACGGDPFNAVGGGDGGTAAGSGASGTTGTGASGDGTGGVASSGAAGDSSTIGNGGAGGSAGNGAAGSIPPRDASTVDGTIGVTPDAGRDAAVTSRDASTLDAATKGFCDTTSAVFCADFDRVNAVSDGWTTSNVTVGAVVDFNLVAYASPKRSLHSKVPAGTGPNTAIASLTKTLSTPHDHTILDFDLDVTSIGATADPTGWLLQIARLGRNASDGSVGLYATASGGWQVVVGAGQIVAPFDLPGPPPFGKFVHVTLDVVWNQTAGSVRLTFDGTTVLAKEGITDIVTPGTSSIDAIVGLADGAGSTPASEMSVDNVVVQFK
jgi:hypothetical protein